LEKEKKEKRTIIEITSKANVPFERWCNERQKKIWAKKNGMREK